MANSESKPETCWHCGVKIVGEPTWLAHDGGDDHATRVETVYPLHANCANQAWPMYEVTPEQAATIKRGD